ncbi:MAG: outer membrane lipoprotein carrier protein LolA [Bacteroidetes bacterium]|nr:outer membrane lipoprotein carrier protein LolA [Bacteroidota bacterium]
MRLFYLLVAFFTVFNVSAQKDSQAKAILDQIGAKVKGAKGILVSIELISKNSKGKALGSKSINLKMKGDKYLLKQGGTEILCDGSTIYNFDGVNTISKSNISESDQTLSPQKLLSGNYDKYFNYSVLSQNSNSATIELIPIDKRKSFQKVTLVIDKLKSALSTATILDKSNNSTFVKVLSINYTVILIDKIFLFDRSKYPKNVEIFD